MLPASIHLQAPPNLSDDFGVLLDAACSEPLTEEEMAALLDRRRYLNNLVRDVTETLGS